MEPFLFGEGTPENGHLLHSPYLTYPLKMVVSNRNLLFHGSIFRCYVSFREAKKHCLAKKTDLLLESRKIPLANGWPEVSKPIKFDLSKVWIFISGVTIFHEKLNGTESQRTPK